MTVTLRHAVKIAANRHRVFTALTDIAEISLWHMGNVDGEVAIGQTFKINPKPGVVFSWITKEIIPDQSLRQECIEGPGNSVGKNLTLTLSDVDDGTTVVHLSDGGWPAADSRLPFCNTYWASVLLQLKQYIESSSASRSGLTR